MPVNRMRASFDFCASFFYFVRASVLAVLLVCVVVLASGTAAGQGFGTTSVSNFDDLQDISDDLNGDYVLVSDIEASGEEGFEPIGDEDSPFTGTFDGDGHTVSGLTVNRPDEDDVGLFGYVDSDGVVENVGLEGVDVKGGDSVGGLVGYNDGELRRSHVTGSVEGVSGVGGLVGRNTEKVTESYAEVDVKGESNVGGLVGRNAPVGEVSESYAKGTVEGKDVSGGAVGSNGGDVADTYARVDVRGESTLGGLVGANVDGTVVRSYSSGRVSGVTESGGLVGRNTGEVRASYWDIESSQQGEGELKAGEALSTAEMTGESAVRNMEWNFDEYWEAREDGYPVLAWQVYGYERTRERGGTSPDEGLPGFGVLAAVAAVLVGGALIRRKEEIR